MFAGRGYGYCINPAAEYAAGYAAAAAAANAVAAVELGMQELLALRELDDERFVGARLGKAISSWLPAMNLAQEQPSEPTSSSTSGQ